MCRLILTTVLASTYLGCGFSFDPASQVKDLRILAIEVDPPELTPTFTGQLTVKALVVDTPPLESISWSLAMCLVAPRTGTGSSARCPSGSTTTLLQQTTSLDAVGFSAPLPPQVSALLASKQAISPQLQLELTVGDAPLYAEKAVTLTPVPSAGQDPNANPVLTELTFDGQPWLPGTPLSVHFGGCDDAQKETITNADRTKSTFCTHQLVPTVDVTQAQFYSALSSTTGVVTTQQERLRFAWFADQGVFHHDTTSQSGTAGTTTDISNVWREAAGVTGLVNFWIVVRDGRSGESWEQRQLQVQ